MSPLIGNSTRRLLLMLGGLLFFVLLTGGPARAHSEILSITPADGSAPATAPTEVVLVFSAPVLGDFTKIQITGPDGTPLTLDPPVSSNDTVTQALPKLTPGAYTVTYRIVSADSHPISGQSTFTSPPAESPATSTPTPSASSPAPSPNATLSSGSTPTATTTGSAGQVAPTASDGHGWWWIIGGLLLALAAAALVRARRRRG